MLNAGEGTSSVNPEISGNAGTLVDDNQEPRLVDEQVINNIQQLESEKRHLQLQLDLAQKRFEVEKLKGALHESNKSTIHSQMQGDEARTLHDIVDSIPHQQQPPPQQTVHDLDAITRPVQHGLSQQSLQDQVKNAHHLLQPTEVNDLLRMDLNPHAYLKQQHGSKYKAIVNYIPKATTCEEEEVEISSGVYIKLKTGTKPKLEEVTPAQWTVANARIMAEILEESPAADLKTVTLDYLSHTAKMGELATRYTWASVILLDNAYRHRQAQFGFRWGSDTPHMSMLVLRERDRPRSKPHVRAGMKHQGENTQQQCHMFNSGKPCSYGKVCRFLHTCAICGGDHPRVHHSNNDNKGSE